jgi:hypothetical protein
VAGHPIADDRGEFPELETAPSVRPGRDPERVFVKPKAGGTLAGIEALVGAGLRKKIHALA